MTLTLEDPDGDGKPGISWPASTVIIVVVVATAALLWVDKIPVEILVLLLGGIGEHVRGRAAGVVKKKRAAPAPAPAPDPPPVE